MRYSPNTRHFPYKHPTFGTRARPKGKSAWEASVYYWWWAYLKRNADYLTTCASNGHGKCVELYQEFGDVRSDDFKAWWTERGRGVHLFAEPRAEDSIRVLEAGEAALDQSEALTLSLPLYLPKKALEARIKVLLAVHHKGKRGHQLAKKSRARFQVQGQPNVPALRLGLAIYDAKIASPYMPLWKIGDLMPGVLRTQKLKAGDDREDLLLKKRALAATVSRYLRRVETSIQRAGSGLFP
jgi:hypothetical protein